MAGCGQASCSTGATASWRACRAALDASARRGSCLLVHGDAGIGKSALVDALADEARSGGRAVLTTAGVPSEAHLPFAGLHQLLDPVLGHVDDLPPELRAALLGALGREDADVHDVMAVALAALALVRERAAAGGALVVVEDVRWLDRPSANVLSFVARRIDLDPVLVVATAREVPAPALADVRFTPVALGPIDDAAARDLVAAHAPTLDPHLADQLIREAAGNPLALVELAAAWSVLPPGTIVQPLVPVTTRLVETFASRVDTLPAACRDLLLVAAVDEGHGLREILAATVALGHPDVTHDDLYPAVEARLVEIDARGVRFRHPLVRSTTYRRADGIARRAAHAALADAIDDPDRAAWHRAAALVEPDEGAAAALEQAGERGPPSRRAARGGHRVRACRRSQPRPATPRSPARPRGVPRPRARAERRGRPAPRRGRTARPGPGRPRTGGVAAPGPHRRCGGRRGARPQALVDVVGRMRDAGDVDLAVDSLVAVATQAYWRGLDRRRARAAGRGRRVAAGRATTRVCCTSSGWSPRSNGARRCGPDWPPAGWRVSTIPGCRRCSASRPGRWATRRPRPPSSPPRCVRCVPPGGSAT